MYAVCLCPVGIMLGHVTPEARSGGPLALVEDGDEITIDVTKKQVNLVRWFS